MFSVKILFQQQIFLFSLTVFSLYGIILAFIYELIY